MGAGLLKEVAVEYAKTFQATHVILHRYSYSLLASLKSN